MMRTLLIILGCLTLFSTVAFAQDDKTLTTIPHFSFYNAMGNTFDEEDAFEPGAPFIMVYFSPTCEHCQQQAEWLSQRAGELAHIQFLYVTANAVKEVPAFDNQYFDGSGLNVKYGIDKDYMVDTYFGYTPVPTMYIFDAGGKFLKKFNKEVRVDDILMTLN